MKEECCWADILSGIGGLMVGIAAMWAVWFAREPITNYISYMKQSQSQSQHMEVKVINSCEADREATTVSKAQTPQQIDLLLDQVPTEFPKDNKEPMGLLIAPEFRDDVRLKLQQTPSEDGRKRILEEYWNKSVSKEVKSPVHLKLMNGKKD